MKHLEPGLSDVHIRRDFQAIKQMQPDGEPAICLDSDPRDPMGNQGQLRVSM